MKYISFLLLLCCLSTGKAFAQKPADPCCEIVGINSTKGTITSRNTSTGKVQQFKTTTTAMGRIRMGDELTLQNGRITAVNGNGFDPVNEIISGQVSDATPCCEIVSIQVNDAEPCCEMVTVKDMATGQMHSFKSLAGIGKTLKVGQPVILQNGYAMVQAGATASAAQKGWYAFKAGSVSETSNVKDNNNNEGTPCCEVMNMSAAKGTITSRNTTTGKVQQFKTSTTAMGRMRMGDVLTLQNGRITAINGNGFEPINEIISGQVSDGDPCCTVVSLQVNDVDPCCEMVTVKDMATGQMHSFKSLAGIGKTLKVGQPVILQNGYAMVQAGATASAAQKGWYAFKAGAANTTSEVKESAVETSDEKWVITPNPNLKGAMGRITIRTPEKSTYSLTVLKAGTDQQSAYRYIGTEFLLLPGQYDTRWWDNSKWRLSGVPVQRGMDTRIRAGAVHLNLKYTEWVIYDETKTIVIYGGYSIWRIGLPVGKYYVKVNNDFVEVVIKDGEVTEL